MDDLGREIGHRSWDEKLDIEGDWLRYPTGRAAACAWRRVGRRYLRREARGQERFNDPRQVNRELRLVNMSGLRWIPASVVIGCRASQERLGWGIVKGRRVGGLGNRWFRNRGERDGSTCKREWDVSR